MRDKDADLIWEAYDDRLDNPHHRREVDKLERENPDLDDMRKKAKEEMAREREKKNKVKNPRSREIGESQEIEVSLDELVRKAAEHFDEFRGQADHEEIISHLESHYMKFFNANYNNFANAEQVVNYVEDGGLRQDLQDLLGMDDQPPELDF